MIFEDYDINISPDGLRPYMREVYDHFGRHIYFDLPQLVVDHVPEHEGWLKRRVVWDMVKEAIDRAYNHKIRLSPSGLCRCPFKPPKQDLRYDVRDLV